MKVLLFGEKAADIKPEVAKHADLDVVTTMPDVVVCYGGDGTLLTAERQWPSIPKVPIRHSRRGNRCIAHPAPLVLDRLARGNLVRTEYMKLEGVIHPSGRPEPNPPLTAMNEFSAHLAHINSAVRFRLWIDNEPYGAEREILGDGFVISTPFGSTAYFNHITRGFFHTGIGIAFKSTSEHTNHLVVPEDTVVRVLITRGPALLAYDNCADYLDLSEGDVITVHKHAQPAVLLTWEPMKYPTDEF